MTVTRVLAHMTVADLSASIPWYSRLFGRAPDARPMDGLVEWHLSETFGFQVWAEPERAGHSTMVLDESDLDALVHHLDTVEIPHQGPTDATSVRTLSLRDPDGNHVVFTAPHTRP